MKNITLINVGALMLLAACTSKEIKSDSQETKTVQEITVIEIDSMKGNPNEYLVTENVFLLLPQEHESHLKQAKENLTKKELATAASEIKHACTYLSMEISQAEESEKPRLNAAKTKLINISERLEKGEKVSETELKKAFYDTNLALYKNYLNKQNKIVMDYKTDKNLVGFYLEVALQKAENAEKWSDTKFDQADNTLIAEGKLLSKKMKADIDKDKEIIKNDWNFFLKKLKRLDEKLEGSALD